MSNYDEARVRSFIERYVIERASTFRQDKEQEDGWKTIQMGISLYKMIEQQGKQLASNNSSGPWSSVIQQAIP